ncbi:pectinesterase inhibitor-like [Humulus lupulus]|uniref:pectinesterase inhibitor-like n=1 Tax=Humulus lupulus TaxID=3486 RepID=UPI002B40430A|nr:pectinesterase inhibitor-like [Humulus lupulus]
MVQTLSFFIITIILLTTIPYKEAHQQHFLSSNLVSSQEIINQTCTKCADLSEVFSYNFCAASLHNVPISHAITNLQGLALVAMELALDYASATVVTIEKILDNSINDSTTTGLDPFSSMCLNDCLELYSDAVTTLVDAIEAFMNQNYETARVWLSAVMEASSTCEEGFKERGEEVESPLVKENYRLFQLCDIALCIATLLTSHSS